MDSEILLNAKKIGIMGGTFDPIHYGHLIMAENVRESLGLELILFLPTGNPPHKANENVSDSKHRLFMTLEATNTNPHFFVSDMEINRQGASYTVDTLRQIHEMYGNISEIYFIIGTDEASNFLKWKKPKDVLKLCTLAIVSRPGYKKNEFIKEFKNVWKDYKEKVVFAENNLFEYSSTNIRGRVQSGKSIRYMVPLEVENYITKNELYKKNFDFQSIEKYVQDNISAKRYNHTQGVMKEAKRLANIYSGDVDKASISALLHDCAKEMPSAEKRAYCEKNSIELDDFIKNQIELSHGKIASHIAENVFGIHDVDVLNSISNHTVGRPEMSLNEQIVFVADLTEEGRGSYVNEVREATRKNIDFATYTALKKKMEFCTKQGKGSHPLAIEALKYYSKIVGRRSDID